MIHSIVFGPSWQSVKITNVCFLELLFPADTFVTSQHENMIVNYNPPNSRMPKLVNYQGGKYCLGESLKQHGKLGIQDYLMLT